MIIHKTINKCGAENNIATKLMFSQGNSKDFLNIGSTVKMLLNWVQAS